MPDGTTTWAYTYGADGMRIDHTKGTDAYSYVNNGRPPPQMNKNDALA